MIEIHPSARISESAKLEARGGRIGANVVIGDGCAIDADELVLHDNVQLGTNVTIRAKRFVLGYGTRVERDSRFAGIGGPAVEMAIGDECFIGEAATILLPRFVVGDYVAMHNHLLANGYQTCAIGHNCWIGQNCVLNATALLTIGNNVGLGAYSSVYTHAFNGELLEGCEIFNMAPVVIEDNVWIVGSYNVISPGVTLGKKSMVLTSSVVSKSVPPMHTVAGVPAKDLTDRLKPFRDVTVEEKLTMMRRFAGELAAERYPGDVQEVDGGFLVGEKRGKPYRVLCVEDASTVQADERPAVVYAIRSADLGERVTVFDLSTKRYTKRRTFAEIEAIKFMNGYRARFVPEDQPVVA